MWGVGRVLRDNIYMYQHVGNLKTRVSKNIDLSFVLKICLDLCHCQRKPYSCTAAYYCPLHIFTSPFNMVGGVNYM